MPRRLGGLRPSVPPVVLGMKYGAGYMLAAAGAQWLDRWHPFNPWRPLMLGVIAALGAYAGAAISERLHLRRDRIAQVSAVLAGTTGALVLFLVR
jgi:hypothetical protein